MFLTSCVNYTGEGSIEWRENKAFAFIKNKEMIDNLLHGSNEAGRVSYREFADILEREK